ncbi:MAG: methionine biosynthesis protein MetW [Sphingomonadales bacterium]|jgi:methionine biosynthesis protein MetW
MSLRPDLAVLADLVSPGSRVLDIGCGEGALLAYLEQEKGCDARGLEISHDGVQKGVERGLSIVQGNADTDLVNYPDDGFDYVILSQTLQATQSPKEVLQHLLRIAPRIIISIPNFGYWRIRLSLLLSGRMPISKQLPARWYDTPNIHLCTICDLVALTQELDANIDQLVVLDDVGHAKVQDSKSLLWANLTATQAVFLISRA